MSAETLRALTHCADRDKIWFLDIPRGDLQSRISSGQWLRATGSSYYLEALHGQKLGDWNEELTSDDNPPNFRYVTNGNLSFYAVSKPEGTSGRNMDPSHDHRGNCRCPMGSIPVGARNIQAPSPFWKRVLIAACSEEPTISPFSVQCSFSGVGR